MPRTYHARAHASSPEPDSREAAVVRAVVHAVADQAARFAGRRVQPEAQDIYKLVFHAALGSEHAVTDSAAATRWMEREVATLRPLDDAPVEPMVESLGDYARVHLRPFIAAGGSTTELLAAFIRTAERREPRERLERFLDAVVEAAASASWPWRAEALAAHFAEQQTSGYPAVHHSAAFGTTYVPAYRVVAVRELPALIPELLARVSGTDRSSRGATREE